MGSNTAAIETTVPHDGPVTVAAPAAIGLTGPVQSSSPQPIAEAVTADVIPSSPPPEVMDAIAAAGAVYEQLQRAGRRIHFALDQGGRVQIELQDLRGESISGLSPAAALRAAAGGAID